MWLTPTQARWLGHLYHAAALRLPLSEYAAAQRLSVSELLSWDRRLRAQGLAVPKRRRPARFVAVELAP